MTPEAFVAKWSEATTKERASAQSHFNDLCALIDERTPHEADPHGEWYAFEKGVEKTGAGHGWADVWKRGCFGWEYKSKSGGRESTMSAALAQLQLYALALESPPLLIVSDIDTIEIHTAFQNAVQEVHLIKLEDIKDHETRMKLKWAFSDPERLRPTRTRNQITQEAASKFAKLAFDLRTDGHDPQAVAHFLNKILFCMFAEDAGILRSGLFTEVSEAGIKNPDQFDAFVKRLFQVMATGGPYGHEIIEWFNGGLFDDDATLPLTLTQIRIIRDMALMDWSQIEPAIFGTLFERGLDPEKRSQLGAHYTDPGSIMRLVNPTVVEPLLAEWSEIRPKIAHQMAQLESVKTKRATENRRKAAQDLLNSFLEKLRNFRVLDPACGSGNFLYMALHALKNIEHRVNVEAEALGLVRQIPQVGPENVLGIEINSYAADLARVTIWIGEIQWMLTHGYAYRTNPILKPLQNIEERDAVIAEDWSEPDWPVADVIIGNPPFLGGSKKRASLGDEYFEALGATYARRVPNAADLVTYWFEKARKQIEFGYTSRAGLVATQSIRKGASGTVLRRIADGLKIYAAYSDEPWTNEGASVRVSLIAFSGKEYEVVLTLDENEVAKIQGDLTAAENNESLPIYSALRLSQNDKVAFEGTKKYGNFDISGEIARQWLVLPNPHGKPNSDVIKPWRNGRDITQRCSDHWIIDFGPDMPECDASLYEIPYNHVLENVRPARQKTKSKLAREKWWIHERSRPDLRFNLGGLSRYLVTPRVAKHRFFVWLDSSVLPDTRLCVITRDDDVCFGVLSSTFHEVWALAHASRHGVGNDPTYNNRTCFDTFPFPDGLFPCIDKSKYSNACADEIAIAAKQLNQLRENWLNPPEWVDRVPEVVPGYRDRIIPKPEHETNLKKRTLTNLYNAKPVWLQNAHRKLDEAVAAAYGWDVELSDEEILGRLLELNLSRSQS